MDPKLKEALVKLSRDIQEIIDSGQPLTHIGRDYQISAGTLTEADLTNKQLTPLGELMPYTTKTRYAPEWKK